MVCIRASVRESEWQIAMYFRKTGPKVGWRLGRKPSSWRRSAESLVCQSDMVMGEFRLWGLSAVIRGVVKTQTVWEPSTREQPWGPGQATTLITCNNRGCGEPCHSSATQSAQDVPLSQRNQHIVQRLWSYLWKLSQWTNHVRCELTVELDGGAGSSRALVSSSRPDRYTNPISVLLS